MRAAPAIPGPVHMHGPAPGSVVHRKKARRAFWLRQVYSWHWISSGICLVGMLLFAVTGITLNHAADIAAEPVVTEIEATLPPEILGTVAAPPEAGAAPLPPALRQWLEEALSTALPDRAAEWSEDEIYLALPRPGGDAWLSIDRRTGEILYEHTDRGWISYLNDLHKGRNTGTAWSWFIDVFAAACLVFSLTGLVLLQTHAARRPATWPVVGMGLCIPILLAAFFIH